VWIGGILETADTPGELFRTIIKDQFQRIRNADRFWFESKQNKYAGSLNVLNFYDNMLIRLFTNDEIKRIKEITLRDIIMAVTQMKDEDIQQNPFQAPSPSGASRFKHCHTLLFIFRNSGAMPGKSRPNPRWLMLWH